MLRVTLRGIVTHLRRLLLTVVAVALSVAFMTGTQVLTATIQANLDKVFADVFKDIDAVVRSSEKVETGFGTIRGLVDGGLVEQVRDVEGVAAAGGQVQKPVTVLDKQGEPLGFGNVGPPTFALNWHTEPLLNGWRLSEGREPRAPNEVVLDRKTASDAGYTVGDRVGVQFNKGVRELDVVGIAGFGSSPNLAGSPAVLLETATAQELLLEPGKFNAINVAGDDVSQEELADRVRRVLPRSTDVLTGAELTAESQDAFRRALGFLGTALLVFGLVAMFVGAFIIYNTFAIIVAQSARQLALLRALGSSRSQVVGSVATEALIVGAVASLIGLAFGVLLASGLTSLLASGGLGPQGDGLTFTAGAFVSSFAVGTGVTLVAGLVPAWKASRVPPVAAMRDVAIDTSGSSLPRLALGGVMTAAGAALLYASLFTKQTNALTKLGISFALVFLGVAALGPLFSRPMSAVIAAPLRSLTGRLGRSNAMRNPKRTSTTASALMIGIGLIVLFAVLVESIKTSARDALDATFTGDFVIDSGSFGQFGLDPGLARDIAQVPGVAAATGLRVGQFESGGKPANLLGVDPVALQSAIKIEEVAGDLDALGDDAVAVTKRQAEEEGYEVGQRIPATFVVGGTDLVPIGAIYHIEAQPNSGYLMTYEGFARRVPPNLNADLLVYVKLDQGADVAAVKAELQRMVKARFPTAKVQDLTEYKASQTGLFDVILVLINVLLVLAVFIALLGIFNTLLLSVYERTREIGLLRAIGMQRRQVRATIRWESIIFAVQGTLLGIAIGFGFAWALVQAISQDSPLAFVIPAGQVIFMVALAVVLGLLAAVIPAITASRLDVLEAIATE